MKTVIMSVENNHFDTKMKVTLMVKLAYSSTYEIKPIPPYNFSLTVRKPAGWPLFTPLEVYGNNTLWTAVQLNGTLIGLRLNPGGSIGNPRITKDFPIKHTFK
jgi:hypothetical protein